MRTTLGGMPLSRSMMLSLDEADREAAKETRRAAAEAEERQGQLMAEAQAHFAVHGESHLETMMRQAAIDFERERRAEVSRAQKRREQVEEYAAAQLVMGRRPRSHEEILLAARCTP